MEKISNRQLYFMGAAYVLNASLVSLPSQVIKIAKADSWLSYVSASLVIILSIWLLSKISARYPDKDLYQAMIEMLPVVGRIIAFVYIFSFFLIMIRDIRMMTDFINVSLLPTTPLMVIALLITATVVRISKGGIEILGRMTELWFPVLLCIMIMVPFLLVRDFEYRFFKPFFEQGVLPALQGGWYAVSYIGEIVALPFLFSGRTFQLKHGLISLGLGVTCLLLINYYTILALGIHVTSKLLYPTYETVRQIRITDFLDRFDLPLVGVYLPTMLTKIAFSLYLVCHGLSRVMPSVSARHIATPIGVFAYVCSFWFFKNSIQLFNLNRTWPVYALVFELVIPVILYFLLRNKKAKKTVSDTP